MSDWHAASGRHPLRGVQHAPQENPDWAGVINKVVIHGRPAYLESASDIYDRALRTMTAEADTLAAALDKLSASWSGKAFDSYRATVQGIIDGLHRAVEDASVQAGVVGGLRNAARILAAHQSQVPIPEGMIPTVKRLQEQGGEVTQQQLRDAVTQWYNGLVQALTLGIDDPASSEMDHQTDRAREVLHRLSEDYANANAEVPDDVRMSDPVITSGPGGGPMVTPGGFGGSAGGVGNSLGAHGLPHTGNLPTGGLADHNLDYKSPTGGAILPVATGHLPGSLDGGLGQLAGASGLGGKVGVGNIPGVPTGTIFGTPVTATYPQNTLGRAGGIVPGMGGAHGGGAGEESGPGTWLVEDEDPWSDNRDVPPGVLT